MENRQVSVGKCLRKPDRNTSFQPTETLRKRAGNILHVSAGEKVRKRETLLPFFSYTFPVVSDLRKRNGNVNYQVSVTFPNYGNALFHPVLFCLPW